MRSGLFLERMEHGCLVTPKRQVTSIKLLAACPARQVCCSCFISIVPVKPEHLALPSSLMHAVTILSHVCSRLSSYYIARTAADVPMEVRDQFMCIACYAWPEAQ